MAADFAGLSGICASDALNSSSDFPGLRDSKLEVLLFCHRRENRPRVTRHDDETVFDAVDRKPVGRFGHEGEPRFLVHVIAVVAEDDVEIVQVDGERSAFRGRLGPIQSRVGGTDTR